MREHRCSKTMIVGKSPHPIGRVVARVQRLAAVARAAGERSRDRLAAFGVCRRGATVVEYALVAPPLFLMLFGLLEFGIYAWNRHSIEFATEETARSVMTKTEVTNESIVADLKSLMTGIDTAALTATVTQDTIGTTKFVNISLSYTYSFNIVGGFVGLDPIIIESKSRVPLRSNE